MICSNCKKKEAVEGDLCWDCFCEKEACEEAMHEEYLRDERFR